MLTSNIDIDDRLINGQIGTVRKIVLSGQVIKIYVAFDDKTAGKVDRDQYGKVHRFVPVERIEAKIKLRENKNSSPVIKRTQFPLMLSWACTVHKVQGLCLDKVVLEKQRRFNSGQMYVALSRVTLLNGLFLIGQYKLSVIKANPNASKEYDRLRQKSPLNYIEDCMPATKHSLTITLLNIRSLYKHAINISCYHLLLKNDIICLTETQILPNQDITVINNTLADFKILYNNSTDKFRSLAFCLNSGISTTNHCQYPGISLLSVEKNVFQQDPVKILLI